MALLLLTGVTGRGLGRRSTTARDEGPTGCLPGLAAAAKEQHASHDPSRLADHGVARDANPVGQVQVPRRGSRLAATSAAAV